MAIDFIFEYSGNKEKAQTLLKPYIFKVDKELDGLTLNILEKWA